MFDGNPESYRCKRSLFFDNYPMITRNACAFYTSHCYYFARIFFEGIGDELLQLFGAIGALCEPGYLFGTACGFFILPKLYR
jgi:hypothetical protein